MKAPKDKGAFRRPEQTKSLNFLYRTAPGRAVLSVLVHPGVSRAAGRFLSSGASRFLIDGFAARNGIDRTEARKTEFRSFNDFFTRELVPGARPIDPAPDALISPCDALLSVYPIEKGAVFTVKNTPYTLRSFLRADGAPFEGGVFAVLRLTVSDYHRYCYFDSGTKGENHFIPGTLHTVNPVALGRYPIYKTNSREYTVLHTDHFGDVIQAEVGALLVGRIVNLHGKHAFSRGEEKGRFEFGGSTIVLIFQKDKVKFDEALFTASAKGYEKKVRMGQKIGEAWS